MLYAETSNEAPHGYQDEGVFAGVSSGQVGKGVSAQCLGSDTSYLKDGGVYATLERTITRMIRDSDRPPVVFLEGGHFDPRIGSDYFARTSLEVALELGAQIIRVYQRAVRVVFGILRDDLGLDCSQDSSCAIRSPVDFGDQLPADLEALLTACRIVKRDRVKISGERAAKNRGLRHLRRILAKKESWGRVLRLDEDIEESRIFLEADDGESVLIARRRAAAWVASCPLIMGQHFADVVTHLERRFSPSAPLLLVDFSQIHDRNKVIRGSELALRLLMASSPAPRQIINLFYAIGHDQPILTADFDRMDFEPRSANFDRTEASR